MTASTSDSPRNSMTTPSTARGEGVLQSPASPKQPDAGSSHGEGTGETFITGFQLWAVTGAVTLVAFLMMLDMSILSTAQPQITSDFHSLSDVGWYSGIYQLMSAAFQPTSGKLFTHFKAKWTFLTFLFVFEVGSLLSAVAPSSPVFITGRAIQGLGSSGLFNGALTIIAGATPLHKRPVYTGLVIGIGQIAIVVAPLIGGALTEYTTWRWCFYINLPTGGLAALLLVLLRIPDVTKKEPFTISVLRTVIPQLDLIGLLMFAPASIMFLLALQFGSAHTYAWNSATIIGLFCGSGVLAILFVFWERRIGDGAMIPGSILSQRIVYSSAGQGSALMSSVIVASAYMPLYFQSVKGASPTMSGVYMLPCIVVQLLVLIVSGIGVSKLGYYLPWSLSGTAIAAIGAGLISTFSPTTEVGKWVGYQILFGAGRGAAMQMNFIALQNALPPQQIPIGLATSIFSQNFTSALSIVIATTIFTQSIVSDITLYAPSVSPADALAAGGGAAEVRALVPPGSPEIDGVLLTFSNAFDRVSYLIAGLCVAAFIFSLGTGWKDTRKQKNSPVGSKNEERKEKDENV